MDVTVAVLVCVAVGVLVDEAVGVLVCVCVAVLVAPQPPRSSTSSWACARR